MSRKSNNPIENMKNKTNTAALRKLFLEDGAARQMEAVLNGEKKIKGPLSPIDIAILKASPEMERLSRLICIERAFNDVGNITMKVVLSSAPQNLRASKMKQVSDFASQEESTFRSITAMSGDFTQGYLKAKLQTLLVNSIHTHKSKLKFSEILLQKYEKECPEVREVMVNAIDKALVGTIERMDGNLEAARQVQKFSYMDLGIDSDTVVKDPDTYLSIPTGEYSYRELIKMSLTEEARNAARTFARYQTRRAEWEEDARAEVAQDDEEKRPHLDMTIEDVKKLANEHKETLPPNISLKDYEQRVLELLANQGMAITRYELAVGEIDSNRRVEESIRIQEQMTANTRAADKKLNEIMVTHIDTSVIEEFNKLVKKTEAQKAAVRKPKEDDEPSL